MGKGILILEMSIIYKTVTVKCNDCFFTGNYHNCTIESINELRRVMEKTPLVSVLDCNHLDYSIEGKF